MAINKLGNMRILELSMTPSHPITSGNRKWINAQAHYLRHKGHEVYFLYISCPILFKPNKQDILISEMKNYWGDKLIVYKAGFISRLKMTLSYKLRKFLFAGYHSADDLCPIGLSEFVRNVHKKFQFDACIVNYYWLTKVFSKLPIAKKAINTHDCFSFKDILCGKYAWMTTWPNEEAKAMQRCNYIFALQKNEAIYFKHLSPKSTVLDVYCFLNYVETPYAGNHNIVFLSSNNDFNVNGLKWFLDKVFPIVINKYPDANLIVGGSISKTARVLNKKNMQILGFIEDPIKFYSLGDICINPTYEGTGLKIKTFESISYGKVTIARVHSTDGIYDLENAPILASDSPDEWLSFFDSLWLDSNYIRQMKLKNKLYIDRMNKHINEQYDTIFKEL